MIPAGQFIEVAFDELDRDPVATLSKIYRDLQLPEFDAAEPVVRDYLETLATFKKNVHPPLATDIQQAVTERWEQCSYESGYPIA